MKMKQGLKLIGILLLCAIAFEILFGSHPIISFTDHRYDIENNPIGEKREKLTNEGYVPVTISSLNDKEYQLSNSLIISKEQLSRIDLNSLLKDTVLFSNKDSSFYYHRKMFKACNISCIKLTIPLRTKHYPKYLLGSGRVSSKMSTGAGNKSQDSTTPINSYPYGFVTKLKGGSGILLDSTTISDLQKLKNSIPETEYSPYPKTPSYIIYFVKEKCDVEKLWLFIDDSSEILLKKQYIQIPEKIDSSIREKVNLLTSDRSDIKLHFWEFNSETSKSQIEELVCNSFSNIYFTSIDSMANSIGAAIWSPVGRESLFKKQGKVIEAQTFWKKYKRSK